MNEEKLQDLAIFAILFIVLVCSAMGILRDAIEINDNKETTSYVEITSYSADEYLYGDVTKSFWDKLMFYIHEKTDSHSYMAVDVVLPSCTKEGYIVYKCSCNDRYKGDVTSVINHTWGDWETVTEATFDATGTKVRHCIVCSEEEFGSIQKKYCPENYVGRWVISDIDVDVALYQQYADEGNIIVDALDSATFFTTSSGSTVIGDHAEQGFDAIKRCSVGMVAEIQKRDSSIELYTCIGVIQGINNGKYLTDLEGNKLYDLYPNTLLCYTCNDSWESVTVVLFNKIEEG